MDCMAWGRYRRSRNQLTAVHQVQQEGFRLASNKPVQGTSQGAKTLLFCGVLVAPLFYLTVLIQAFTRAGFDITRTPLSLLSLGKAGWIQRANFIVTGLLALVCAVGVRRTLAGTRGGAWGPILSGTFGLGLILAGLFHPDPGYGFPPGAGAPAAMLPVMSRHASIHSAGFGIVIFSTINNCFVFFRAFRVRGQAGMSFYSAATGVFVPALLIFAIATNTTGLIIIVGAIAFSWLSVTAASLRANLKGIEA